ncbi:MAG: S41 family peptidase [Paludibacteraceae bacterium]|nr:S41 family peptidase [Paludibacteraceae bacterium]
MNNYHKILALMLVALPMWGGSGRGSLLQAQPREKTTRANECIDIFSDVMRQVDVNYVDTLNYGDLTETAINAMLRKIDPYTVYYPKKNDRDLRMLTTGKYGGIGSIIQQRPRPSTKGAVQRNKGKVSKDSLWTYAVNPYEGKPAQRAGVQAGDRILSVDGKTTKGLSVSEVSNNLRGVPGTTVVLELEREGIDKPFTVSIEREDIHMDPVSYYTVYEADSLAEPVGYIAFGEFTEGSAQSFTNALDDLYYTRGARSLIIDLRGNGGGIVDEALQLVNLFVDRDVTIVETKGKTANSNRTYKTRNNPRYKDMPLVVLVDKNSASASEIVSGALQDLHRATLIGQRTFGKGLVQNLRPVAYGGHVKVTTSKYYLPSGRCIQAIDYSERQKGHELKKDTAGGILPDIVMSDSAKVDICYSLYINHYFFDYATRYHRLHDSIAAPEVFELTDEEIADFCTFLDERGFKYETETSKFFADMMKMAKNEDFDSATLAQLKAFEPVLTPDYREAINRNKEEVKQMLGSEIVLRYYYQKGQAAFNLRYDDELKRALQELR